MAVPDPAISGSSRDPRVKLAGDRQNVGRNAFGTPPVGQRVFRDRRLLSLLLVAPALATVLALFVYPLGYSLVSALTAKDGNPTFDNFAKTFELYGTDILFTAVIVATSTALTGLFAAAIGGYLVLGRHDKAVKMLRWLYRWPLFIPFIVAAQCMRTFLAKNGLLNNTLDALGLVDRESLSGLLDWRGIIVTFVWKETPFVALLVSGAMASLDRAGIEAAQNLGARGLRILVEILLPQVAGVMGWDSFLHSSRCCRCCRCRS